METCKLRTENVSCNGFNLVYGSFFSIGLMQSVVEDVSRSGNLLGFSKCYYFNLVSGNFLVKYR